ncbi:MAG TPA: hypothetical protein VHK24_04620, partial [Steroidobacter sp.]|nr:hypothetical protein [Steroidobacter sp.]
AAGCARPPSRSLRIAGRLIVSDRSDDQILTEYMQRDSEISLRYREIAGGDVPPELDQRVLELARSAAAPRPQT